MNAGPSAAAAEMESVAEAVAATVGSRAGGASNASAGASAGADFWSMLASAQTSDQLCQAWLGILCQWIPQTQSGLLLLHDTGDRYAPAAVWPDPEQDMSFLGEVAQEALVERQGVVRVDANGLSQCAYPLLGANHAYGAVVLCLVGQGDDGMRDTWRLMHWGAGWLVGLFDKRALLESGQRLQQSGLLQDLLVGTQTERGPEAAVRWIVNRLVEGLPCRQAIIGLASGDEVDLASVSGSASFEARSNLLAAAREAMREAIALGQVESHPVQPAPEGGALLPTTAIAEYCQEAGAPAAICLPLQHQGRVVGALLLDFEVVPTPDQRDFCQTLAWVLTPSLALQQTAARNLATHGRDTLQSVLAGLLGPHRPGWKLVALVAAVALLLASVINVDYRVRAPATVEGQVQLSSVAPFDSFVSQARARAGDKVRKGDVLARLDDRDLKLEEAKSASEAELGDRKLRIALARDDAVAVRLAQAEAAQAHAALDMVRAKLARVAITAPFDGVVVKGDLSQQLGAPVEQGKLLFEVASLDAYRVVLRVDERDILDIREGETGELLLTGLPGQTFPIKVNRVTPVAQTEEGVNAFRVEAAVQANGERIQPGMEGVGKVQAGQHTLLWIWFHRLINWARYTAWTLSL